MRLTLVRHGEVIEPYQGKYNGHIDIGLSEHGFEQAKALSKQLLAIKFDKIYCSDLRRAKETLTTLEYAQEVIFSSRLREKSWGRHEGKSFEQIEKEGLKYKNFQHWIDTLDGEDMQEYIERIDNYFKETILKQNAQNILIVTHSGVIKTLLHLTQNISLEEAFSTHLPYSSCITLEL
jgi:broad specificity phosphatase PhoE